MGEFGASFSNLSLLVGAAIVVGAIIAGKLWQPWWIAEWVIIATLAAACSALSPELWPVLLILCFIPYGLLWFASARKSDLVKSPVIPIDVQMALRNPAMLFDLAGLPRAFGWALIVVYVAIAITVLVAGAMLSFQESAIHLAFRVIVLVLAGWHTASYLRRCPAAIVAWIENHPFPFKPTVRDALLPASWEERVAIWTPQFNKALAKHLGPVTFLVYKRSLSWNLLTLLKDARAEPAGGVPQIAANIPRYSAARLPPNIVVMQLESACNPNWAFELLAPFACNLFLPNETTKVLAPLRVNTIGGGSWISEFEMITGLDTRLFGDDGAATHVALAPYIRRALPGYLAERGYETHAFYSAEGLFYNARNAYRSYGYGNFHDAAELGLSPWRSSDIDMAVALVRRLEATGGGPFMAHAITNGAHSPLRGFKAAAGEVPTTFSRAVDTATSRLLTRYTRALLQSAQAVASVLDFLTALEKRTGRPFVLVAYGDHQPWEFTKGGAKDHAQACRTANPLNQTFVHIMASDGGMTFESELPLTLLPSIISMFVEPDPARLYMPVNFQLYAQTGANVFATLHMPRPTLTMMSGGREQEDFSRREAEQRAAAWIANSGHLHLP